MFSISTTESASGTKLYTTKRIRPFHRQAQSNCLLVQDQDVPGVEVGGVGLGWSVEEKEIATHTHTHLKFTFQTPQSTQSKCELSHLCHSACAPSTSRATSKR